MDVERELEERDSEVEVEVDSADKLSRVDLEAELDRLEEVDGILSLSGSDVRSTTALGRPRFRFELVLKEPGVVTDGEGRREQSKSWHHEKLIALQP